LVSFGGTSGDLGRSPSWTVEVDGSACQRAIAARQDGAQNRLSRVEEIATMQVCKYDAPIRRRRGRVTTERRKSVGAEREQKGRERRLEAWPLAGCLPCDSGLRRNRRHRESPTKHPATGRGRGKAVKVYSAKGRRRHRAKVKPRRGVAEGKTPDPLELGRVVGRLTRGAGDSEEAVRAGARHGYA
jgi:hypothetical protein